MSYSLSESLSEEPELNRWQKLVGHSLKEKLSSGNLDEWNDIFSLLYPVAFASSRAILRGRFESECEDIAMEVMREILNQAMYADSTQALTVLTAAIARNKSKDLLRRKLAGKRDSNNLVSLDQLIESGSEKEANPAQADFLDALTMTELRELLTELSNEVKKEYRLVLKDHFFDQMSHTEIANKRKIAVSSVGKYLQRGITCMRDSIARNPKLQNELRETLTDISTAQVLLPLVSAVQMGIKETWDRVKASKANADMTTEEWERYKQRWTDEEILRSAPDEFPEPRNIPSHVRMHLCGALEEKLPAEVAAWKYQKKQEAELRDAYYRRIERKDKRTKIAAFLVIISLASGLAFGFIRLLQYLLRY